MKRHTDFYSNYTVVEKTLSAEESLFLNDASETLFDSGAPASGIETVRMGLLMSHSGFFDNIELDKCTSHVQTFLSNNTVLPRRQLRLKK